MTSHLLQMKNNLEIFKSCLEQLSNTNNDSNCVIEKEVQDIINIYNSFFSPYFINILTQDTEKIITKINHMLKTKCEHEIVCDDVDISPERSIPIQYCMKCFTTM